MPAKNPTRALLLLDLVYGTVRPEGSFGQIMAPDTDFDGLLSRIRHRIDQARRDGDLVVWVVPGAEFMKRMSGVDPQDRDLRPDELAGTPAEGEPLVMKAEIGGFEGSDLDDVLKQHGITEIVLVGVATQYVVDLTTREGAALGYDVTVLASGCADVDEQTHARVLAELRGVDNVKVVAGATA
jgi:nicotinamidase-related amidase